MSPIFACFVELTRPRARLVFEIARIGAATSCTSCCSTSRFRGRRRRPPPLEPFLTSTHSSSCGSRP